MSQYNVANLQDLTNRPVTANTLVLASDHEGLRNDVENRVANLNDAFQGLATCQAGVAAPTGKRAGGIWFDTGNKVWQGDPDGLGYDDTMGTRLTLYGIDFATAGTGTFKDGGEIDVDTTAVAVTDDGADLITFALPGSTIDAVGSYIDIVNWGTCAAATGDIRIFVFGSVHTITWVALTATWRARTIVVKISSTQIKVVSCISYNSDGVGAGASPMAVVATFSVDTTADGTVKMTTTAGFAGTVTHEGMIVKYR